MLRTVVLLVIRAYQLVVSPSLVGSCRFSPSCSDYTAEAIVRHGVARGSWLGLKRLAKCHPFGPSGLDPVPVGSSRSRNSGA